MSLAKFVQLVSHKETYGSKLYALDEEGGVWKLVQHGTQQPEWVRVKGQRS